MPNASSALNCFAALGDPTRRTIFERIAERPLAVGELARGLPVSRPAVSQHLRVLKDAGLVVEVAAGTRRIYRLDPRGIGAMRDWLDAHWTTALDAFQAFADSQRDSQRDGPPDSQDPGGDPGPADPEPTADRHPHPEKRK